MSKASSATEDTGNPTDTVYEGKSQFTTHYHDDKECSYLRSEPRTPSREKAKSRGLSPCKLCVLDSHAGGCGTGGKSELERLIEQGEADHVIGD